ncbi:helix-turn-helix transcriptional regulator [Aliivibrio fischeri]
MNDNLHVTPLGKILRAIRIKECLTLRDMAVSIGIGSAYLSSIEYGKIIDSNVVEKIKTVYKLNSTQISALNNQSEN